jgi:hypothetical protein
VTYGKVDESGGDIVGGGLCLFVPMRPGNYPPTHEALKSMTAAELQPLLRALGKKGISIFPILAALWNLSGEMGTALSSARSFRQAASGRPNRATALSVTIFSVTASPSFSLTYTARKPKRGSWKPYGQL